MIKVEKFGFSAVIKFNQENLSWYVDRFDVENSDYLHFMNNHLYKIDIDNIILNDKFTKFLIVVSSALENPGQYLVLKWATNSNVPFVNSKIINFNRQNL